MQSRKRWSVIKNSPPSLPVITARMLASITSTINPMAERCIILPPLRHPSPSIPIRLAVLLAACLRRGFHPQASCDRSPRNGRVSDKGHGPGSCFHELGQSEKCHGGTLRPQRLSSVSWSASAPVSGVLACNNRLRSNEDGRECRVNKTVSLTSWVR